MSTPRPDERLGTPWLARAGMAVLLVGLVLSTRWASPGSGLTARVLVLIGLYAVGGLALGVGRWLEGRHGRDDASAQVLVAGGLAALYHTTFAAHHVRALQVVSEPAVALVLLLAAVTAVVVVARGRPSSMGVVAVLLALAAGLASPPVAPFSLASNAVLAGAACLFLVRNAWSALPLGLMAATYLTLGYWLLYPHGALVFPPYLGAAAFRLAATAIFIYWAVFAATMLAPPDPEFTLSRRAAFLATSTAGAAALLALILPQADLRLVALALVALALSMAAQHADSDPLRAGAALVALLAATLGIASTHTSAWPAVTVGALLVFTACWVDRHSAPRSGLNRGTLYFGALGYAVWLMATLRNVPLEQRSLALALLFVVLALGALAAGFVPLVYLAQGFLVAAYATFLRRAGLFAGPTWHVIVLLAATAAATAWWRTRTDTRLVPSLRALFTFGYGVAAVAVVFIGLRWRLPTDAAGAWLAIPAGLALAALAYAMWSGDWPLGLLGQAYLLVAVAEFWLRWAEPPRPAGNVMLSPLVALVATAVMIDLWRRRRVSLSAESEAWATRASLGARLLAAAMLIVWVEAYVPEGVRFLTLEVAALVLLWWGGELGNGGNVAESTILSTGGLLLFWMAGSGRGGWSAAALAAFVLLLVQQQLWRRRYAWAIPAAVHDPAMVLGVGSLWRFVHVTVAHQPGAEWLGVAWAGVGLAVCGLGLWLEEPRYRQIGLVILAFAVLRVTVLDRAAQVSPARLLSLLAVGAILLGLGFLYDRRRTGGALESRENLLRTP